MTIRATLTWALLKAAFYMTIMGATLYISVATMEPTIYTPGTGTHEDIMAGREHVKGSPDAVLERMGDKCWRGDAPSDVTVPGHVVYAQGTSGALVGGSRMVGIALESIFEKPVNGLTVYAFCR